MQQRPLHILCMWPVALLHHCTRRLSTWLLEGGSLMANHRNELAPTAPDACEPVSGCRSVGCTPAVSQGGHGPCSSSQMQQRALCQTTAVLHHMPGRPPGAHTTQAAANLHTLGAHTRCTPMQLWFSLMPVRTGAGQCRLHLMLAMSASSGCFAAPHAGRTSSPAPPWYGVHACRRTGGTCTGAPWPQGLCPPKHVSARVFAVPAHSHPKPKQSCSTV